MKSFWVLIIVHLSRILGGERSEPLIQVVVGKNPVTCEEGEPMILPVTVIGAEGKQVSWWSPASNDRVWDHGFVGNAVGYRGRVVAFQNGSLFIKETRLRDAGEWKYAFLIPVPMGSNVREAHPQYVPGKITLQVLPKTRTPAPTSAIKATTEILQTTVEQTKDCPSMQPGPASGLTSTSIPGTLFNNVKFIHVPVALNLSKWNMAEFGSCAGSNVSLFFSSLLVDLVASYVSRTQDPFAEPDSSHQRGIFRSRKLNSLDSLVGTIPGLFGSGMSIWNRADLAAIRKHVGNFEQREGQSVLKPALRGIEGLAEEERFTVYNMKDIAQLFDKTQEKINEIVLANNVRDSENNIGKGMMCTAYGSFVLTRITNVIRDIQSGKIPDILRDKDLTQWYCTRTNSSGGMNVNRREGCKTLPVSTIRNIGIVTPHPNSSPLHCMKNQSTCSYRDLLYISFTMSLPVFHPQEDFFDKLASVHSLGYVEKDIYKERLNLPELLIQVKGKWKAPHTACCTVKENRYLCRCDVFEIDTPVCGLSNEPKTTHTGDKESSMSRQEENGTQEMETNCPVKLTKWRMPMTKVTYNMDGRYCVVTNHKTFLYGGQSCPIPVPNFCFIPHECTIIGETVVTPIPVINKEYVIESTPDTSFPEAYIPHFDVHIDTLSLNLHNLLTRKDMHVIQISNSMAQTEQQLNELLHDGDFSLITTNTWIEIGIKGLLIFQLILLIIMVGMITYLNRLFQRQREKLKMLMEIRHKQLLS